MDALWKHFLLALSLSLLFSQILRVCLCFFTDRKQLRKTSFFSDLFSSENCGLVSSHMLQKQSRRLRNNSMLSLEKSVLPDLSASEMLQNKSFFFFFSDSKLFLLSNYYILVTSSNKV